MPQIFDDIANESTRYMRNELEYNWTFSLGLWWMKQIHACDIFTGAIVQDKMVRNQEC